MYLKGLILKVYQNNFEIISQNMYSLKIIPYYPHKHQQEESSIVTKAFHNLTYSAGSILFVSKYFSNQKTSLTTRNVDCTVF